MKRKITLIVVICMAIMSISMFSACNKVLIEEPTNLKYDGVSISWDKLENVSGYNLKIFGADGTLVSENQPITNVYSYDSRGRAFKVEVAGIPQLKKLAKKIKSATAEFFPLKTIELAEIVADDVGNLSWTKIEGANGYQVRVNGGEPIVVDTCTFGGLATGNNKVEIKPIVKGDPSHFAAFSAIKTVNILATPSNIKYDGVKITWSGMATSYQVFVNDQPLDAKNIVGSSATYESNNENFSVAIQSVGDHNITFNSQVSEKENVIYMPTVTNMQITNGLLTWDTVQGATGYKIKINNVLKGETLTENKYTKLNADVDYSIAIMPISNVGITFSTWSAVRNFRLLPAPVLRWSAAAGQLDGEVSNCLAWDGVDGADGYSVWVTSPNGETVENTLAKDTVFYGDSFLAVGKYSITIKANAPKGNINLFDSVISERIEISRLPAPTAAEANFVVSDPNSLSGFTVSYKTVANATSYQLYLNDTPVEGKTTSGQQIKVDSVVDKTVTAETTLNFFVKTKGGVRQVNGVTCVFLDSLTGSNLSFDIKVLATPTNVDISGFEMSWGAISNANGYVVKMAGTSYNAGSNKYKLDELKAGSYTPVVSSKGNGANVLPSNPTAQINLVRCETPANIAIGLEGISEGHLSCDKVVGAQSYKAYIGNDQTAMDIQTMDNISAKISTQGTAIHMYAEANYWTPGKVTYYLTSQTSGTKTFAKLETPTFSSKAFTNTELRWSHNHNNDFTPGYIVFDKNSAVISNGQITGTSLDISYLQGSDKEVYSFKVKAVGDGKKYINSEISLSVTIQKLVTPTINVQQNQYQWNGVTGAQKYQLSIDGVKASDEVNVVGTSFTYIPKLFNAVKTYNVELVAIGDGGITTIDSDVASIKQEVKKLTTPEFSVKYSEPAYSKTGEIVIDITNIPKFAQGYYYVVGGSSSNKVIETTYKMTPNATGNIATSVKAIGGVFDTTSLAKEYYIDSYETTQQLLVLLGAPTVNSIIIAADGKVTWATVEKAAGYKFEYSINGGTWVVNDCTSAMYLLTEYANADTKTIDIRITAKGNESGSIVTSETTTTQLSKA